MIFFIFFIPIFCRGNRNNERARFPTFNSKRLGEWVKNIYTNSPRAEQLEKATTIFQVKEVKKLWKKSLKERRLLITKLDTYGDNFRNVPLVFPAEDETNKKMKDRKLKRLANGEEPLPGGSGRGRKTKGDKEKPPRDPNLPKRPQNPFFQYCKEKREEVAKEFLNSQGVNLTKKELTKILANQWNNLDSDDKMVRHMITKFIPSILIYPIDL